VRPASVRFEDVTWLMTSIK